MKLVNYNKLYGFTSGKKDKFVYIEFKNMRAMNKVKNLWYDFNGDEKRLKKVSFQNTKMEIYESNIPSLLRYFHIHNVSPSGWVYIPINRVFKPPIKNTTCNYEYICKKNQLKPLPDKETRVPYKICSFDIEASSSHGDFPIPKKDYKRLATNIVDIFDKKNKNQTNHANLLLTKIINTAFGFDKFDDVDLVYPKNKSISKEYISNKIEILLTKPIENAKKSNTDEDNSDILTITKLFAKLIEIQQQVNIENENEENGENDYIDDNDEGEYTRFSKNEKKTKIDSTLINVLINENYNREEKIILTNEVMTLLFPRLEGDKVTFIGSTFIRYGEPEPYLNHCFVLDTCDNVDGAIIESVKTETEILCKWTELIQKENPDVIIGYNIFGFDYEFMFRRAQENNCEREFLLLSRKMNELCGKEIRETNEIKIENTKVKLASGEYDLRYFKMSGRLQIDMYTYFRRDFNLSSYKLDSVAGQFISDDVKKIENKTDEIYGNITELYSNNLTGLHVNDYIHIEITGFTADYYADGKKFKVIDIIKNKEVVETIKGNEVKNKYNVIIIEGHHDFDKTKSIKWGTAKDDVSPQDIFRLANGSSADRAIVAKYCIQDCNLVHHLMNKIDVITGYVEMSRICSVPISFLVFRGQGIKLTSYVAKKCREKDTLMPDLPRTGESDGYEGAIVLPPKCSMYMDNPVACVDYASLYPSSMISENLSHDSKVWTKEFDLDGKLIREIGEKDKNGKFIYDNITGYEYINVTFDTFRFHRKTPKGKLEKIKSGIKICRWAQLPNNQKSIMPSILQELLKARSNTRKLAKTEKDPFMQNILDKRQLGYKVTANSLYGQCGAKTSTFYEKDIAASTTATGRKMIIYAKNIIEEVYGNREYDTECHGPVLSRAEYVYGDSVAEYTPILIRYKNKNNGNTDIMTTFIIDIARRCGDEKWIKCTEPGKEEKEYCELKDVESWTENGWTKIHRVIRHKLAKHKKMIRVVTDNGIVDVTDDHSLITSTGAEISSKNCCIEETELLHNPYNYEKDLDIEAFDEILDYFNRKYREEDNIIIIENTSTHYEEQLCPYSAPMELNLKLYKKIKNKTINKTKSITMRIDASTDSMRAQLLVSVVYTLFNQFGFSMKTSYSQYRDEYILTYSPNETEPYNNKIKFMKEINFYGYVYDLTTENHHFAAGIGNLIVHNTDSVFFTFNLSDPKTGEKIVGKKALEVTIEMAQDAAHLCTRFLKAPMELTYEKTLMPFILLSKKRYVGMLYETEANKGKLKYMGLSLKRRDSCDYLKDVYGNILNILIKENNVQSAIEYLNISLENLIQGKVPMEKLVITKALRSDYKNPNQIAHKVLADRIGQRDPGNKPKSGDRMKFIFITTNNKGALLGEKIETPEFIVENKLQIDYVYYITNQLMKPLQQLFGLALEQIWENQRKTAAIKTYKKDMEKMKLEIPDLEDFMKKKEKYCAKKIEELLFKKFLDKIYNAKNKIQTLDRFWG